MAKYINADEVIEKLREVDSKGVKADLYSLVALVTAMNESIIRCKDCVFYEPITFNGKPTTMGYCRFNDVVWTYCRNDNDYCSYAEPKEKTE